MRDSAGQIPMRQHAEEWRAYRRARFMRADAQRHVRSDAQGYMRPDAHRWRCDGGLRFDTLAQKANFNPNQPRVPAGNPDGGQWTDDAQTGGEWGSDRSQWVRVAQLDGIPPGIGHNQGPPLDEPPEIPLRRPKSPQGVNAFLKAAAQWLARATRMGGPIGAYIAAVKAMPWLYPERPYIDAFLDAPRSLEELRKAASDPRVGYNIHHIV